MSANQHIEWLNLVEKMGPFLAVGVLDEAFPQGLEKVETRRRQRVRGAYDEWRDAVDADDPQLAELHREWVKLVLEELLDYDSSVLKARDALPAALTYSEPSCGVEIRPDIAAMAGEKPRLLVAVYAHDTDLNAPVAGDAWAASPIERMIQLCRATGVRLGLVTNGESWSVVCVPSDGGSSIASWFARIWQQEPVTLQAFVSLLGVRRCFGPTDGTLEALLERSAANQNEVTDTLGEQVRRAVEVLVQALDKADAERNRQLLDGVSPAQLYEAGLTVMMRLVVLLCAEQRGLLLLGADTYDQHYAITTLRARLVKEQTDLTDEVQERRHDAWSRILAVCRGVFGGIEHASLRLPPLGGSLFDPDRFPFLEGRPTGSSWRTTPAVPLPIDNRTVLTLLTALQVLEQAAGAQLLSYEALDVEQVGHVYEGLLERTVKRVPEVTLGLIGSAKAYNPNVPLPELEYKSAEGQEPLLSFLQEVTGRSASALRKALDKPADEALRHRIAVACGLETALVPRLLPFANLIREDSAKRLLVYAEGSFIVTLGDSRRATGTHYTPRSLTEPIVQHTLQPLVYVGPAEGKPRAEWKLKSPADLLALKICDMAMGSAAFLVQACRWLADRVAEAWDAAEKARQSVSMDGVVLDQAGRAELLPRDKAERVLIARRLVASRCLYGIDKNPMAVELAKVSLWLVTMMKGRPFSFLDHALKCGDSLLGVSSLKQIKDFSLRPGERQVTFATPHLFRYVEAAEAKRRELEDLPSNDYSQIDAKNRLHAEAEAATAKVKAIADCLIALELRGLNDNAYTDARENEADQVQRLLKQDADAALKSPISNQPSALAAHAREKLRRRRPFHWPVEFPEVFARGGFDAFVGNPPYMGGQKITGSFGDEYRDYLIAHLAEGQRGSADLAAYFLLKACAALRQPGCAGFVTTSAVSEGNTRDVGLVNILQRGFKIIQASQKENWPGSASVTFCPLSLFNGQYQGSVVLNGRPVSEISASLEALEEDSGVPPNALSVNDEITFQGSIVLGMGFIIDKCEASRLIDASTKNRDVIFPYLTGKDINSRWDFSSDFFAINFFDWPLDRSTPEGSAAEHTASDYPLCLKIVEERVKPERTRLDENGEFVLRRPLPQKWWIYGEKRPALYGKLRMLKWCMCVATQATTYLAFAVIRQPIVFSHALSIVASDCYGVFACLNSTLHDIWARKYSSSNLLLIRYTPTTTLLTFPFPKMEDDLTKVGKAYCDLRARIMEERKEGFVELYNRFHDRGEASADLARLRELHAELDQAVATAYGWRRLDLGHGFHSTKQGERYTISKSARRTVLDRLLALNRQRYEEEVKVGLHDKKAGKKKRATPRSKELSEQIQGELI